jgi:hypothetical protein
MRSVKNWIELLTLVGVFIGLGLVILQLRQNEELIRFQIAAEIRVNQDNNRNAIRGEQYSRTLAKLQTSPESLTDEELLQFQAHARSLLNELTFRRILELDRRLVECGGRLSFIETVRRDESR